MGVVTCVYTALTTTFQTNPPHPPYKAGSSLQRCTVHTHTSDSKHTRTFRSAANMLCVSTCLDQPLVMPIQYRSILERILMVSNSKSLRFSMNLCFFFRMAVALKTGVITFLNAIYTPLKNYETTHSFNYVVTVNVEKKFQPF